MSDIYVHATFATWLKDQLDREHLTYEALGYWLGVTKGYIAQLVKGKKPSDQLIGMLAARFEVAPEMLIDYLRSDDQTSEFDVDFIERTAIAMREGYPTVKQFTGDMQSELTVITTLQLHGEIELASEHTLLARNRVARRIALEENAAGITNATKAIGDLKEIYLKILNASLLNASASRSKDEIAEVMESEYRVLYPIALETGQTALLDMATVWVSDGYYIARQPYEAIERGSQLALTSLDPDILTGSLRAVTLSYAYLNRPSDLERMEKVILYHLTERETISDPAQVATLYEAVGRARVIVNLPNVHPLYPKSSYLDVAEEYAIDTENPARRLQVLRSKLVEMRYLYKRNLKPDKDTARAVYLQAQHLAKRWQRHAEEIERLARELNLS